MKNYYKYFEIGQTVTEQVLTKGDISWEALSKLTFTVNGHIVN